ncbi:hypothetical protein ACFL28_01000 [Candidatus Omnitrophota bacterium]
MVETKKMALVIACLSIAGCAVSSQTVKPISTQEVSAPQALPETVAITEEIIEEEIATLPITKEPEIVQIIKDVQAPGRITYSQITNLIDGFLDVQPTEDASGQSKFLGLSENKLVTLEMVGTKDDILQTSIELIYPKNIETIDADLNNALMLRFLRNAVPGFKGWPASVTDIMNKFNSIQLGSTKEERILIGKKIIDVLYDKDISSITVTVKSE